MRILLLASMTPDATGVGAIPRLLHAQLVGLSAHHEVTLLAPFGDGPEQAVAAARLAGSDLDVHLIDRRRSSEPFRRWAVRADLVAAWAGRGWPWRVTLGARGVQPTLDRLARERRFDLIAVEDSPLSVLRLPAGIPSVLTEHEARRAVGSDWRRGGLAARPGALLKEVDRRRWRSFQPRTWERFDLLQVFTEGDAAEVRSRASALAGRVRVNPFGIELPKRADPGREEEGTILFTGTFTHQPNRDAANWLATVIMPALVRLRPGSRLLLVGHNPSAEIIALRGPAIEVIGDAASVDPYLERAAVVVAPVRTGGGMRMKVLEALAWGKATVTTSLGAEGLTAFTTEPPFIVADRDEEIAAGVASLLGEDGRRRKLGAAGRELVERHYAPAPWAARLEVVYEEARRLYDA